MIATPPAVVAPAPAFSGDYETGDFSQWPFRQFLNGGNWCGDACTMDNVGNATAKIVVRPARQGRYAARFQVYSTGTGTLANRAEVGISPEQTGGLPGQSWWYAWWTRFPGPTQTWWSNGADFNDTFQFFDHANHQPWIIGGVDATSGHPTLYDDGPFGHRTLADPLRYGHWYHYVIHATWSTTGGLWRLWLDGTLKQSYTGPTMLAGGAIMYSQGFYSKRLTDNTVIHDGFCRVATRTAANAC